MCINEHNNDSKKKVRIKWRFYFISLEPLFVLLFIKSLGTLLSASSQIQNTGSSSNTKSTTMFIVLVIAFAMLAVFGFILSLKNTFDWKGATQPSYEIEEIENRSFEYLTFLSAIIIPLCFFSFDNTCDVISFMLLLCLIGFIFLRMDLYYSNPTLAILGYRLYKVAIKGHEELKDVTVISKDEITVKSHLKWIELDNNVWVGKVADK